MNSLEQLKQFTTIVVDTADFDSIQTYAPTDATTNPSLILKAVQQARYRPFFEQTVLAKTEVSLDDMVDRVLVAFGLEILKIIPGRISTEVDARLSFDTAATLTRARALIALYDAAGIPRERILIKIASTWEGIAAAEVLEKEGIHCNLTLLFSLPQAVAAANAHVQLISPFVGRIYDWFKHATGQEYRGDNDPGVQSVKEIYSTLRHRGYSTQIMGASFRNIGQIIALAGCDLLTISPELLQKLSESSESVVQKLSPQAFEQGLEGENQNIVLDETQFRQGLSANTMATEKLAEGLRMFSTDVVALEGLITKLTHAL